MYDDGEVHFVFPANSYASTIQVVHKISFSACRLSFLYTVEFLTIRTPPFLEKDVYSYTYYFYSKTQALCYGVSDVQKCEHTRPFCSCCRSYSQGHREGGGSDLLVYCRHSNYVPFLILCQNATFQTGNFQ